MWMNDHDARAAADDREAALADQLDLLAAGRHAGARAVEAAVAQDDAVEVRRPEHERLHLPHRVERRAHRRDGVRVQPVVLRLGLRAGARRRPAGVGLHQQPPGAGGPRAGEQVLGALDAQAVGVGERAVEVAQVREPGERGELVDDGVGPRGGHRGDDRVAVEAVRDDGLGAGRAQGRGLGRGAGHAGHLVAGGHEEGDEPGAECAGGAGEEDAHVIASVCCDGL